MSLHQMLACYFPTTVVLVDDDNHFLESLNAGLDISHASYKCYDNPTAALQFLTEAYHANPFTNRCLLRPEEDTLGHRVLDVDVRKISQEVYNKNRFKEIAVIVVDYAMPGMDGLELCEQLNSLPIKKILLTGYADEQLAIKAFNARIIDKFIRKEEFEFSKIINNAIYDLQREYFKELSELVIASLVRNIEAPTPSLNDPVFVKFFNKLCLEHEVCEYYLLDSSGSYLLLDSNGKPSWLVVRTEDEMRDFCECAIEGDAQAEVIDAICDRSKLPFSHIDQALQAVPAKWAKYMHTAKHFSGKDLYYYAIISDHKEYQLEQKRILSYRSYLDS